MATSLVEILKLVGPLDDASGTDTPRERFRKYLKTTIQSVSDLREYIETCLRESGDPYNRALQDLVNRAGELLGFEVEFGRYRGVSNEIGHDGLWKSSTGLNVIVETKTSDVYTIKTSTVLGYVDNLISEKRVSDWDHALGLYVVARPDRELAQLENAIVAEKRTHQLRVISAEALLQLAELVLDYEEVGHEGVLTLLRPSGPRVDPVINLMTTLVAVEKQQVSTPASAVSGGNKGTDTPVGTDAVQYYLVPVGEEEEKSPTEVVEQVLGANIFAFGERTPHRRHIKRGDWLCFHASTIGVVAHARVRVGPERKRHPAVNHPDDYPWVVELEAVKMYTDRPVAIDRAMRAQLDAFKGKDPERAWGWFVVTVNRINKHDYDLLTRS